MGRKSLGISVKVVLDRAQTAKIVGMPEVQYLLVLVVTDLFCGSCACRVSCCMVAGPPSA